MASTDLQIGGKQSKQSIYKVFRKTIVKPGMNHMNKYTEHIFHSIHC